MLGGIGLLYLSEAGRAADLLNSVRPMGLWAYKGHGLATLCMIWGGMLITSAALLSIPSFRRSCRSTMTGIPVLLRSARRYAATTLRGRRTLLLLLGVLLLGAIARIFFMDQPIRYDEADTYLRFIDDGPLNVFYYPVPNNHVLHTLLVKVVVVLFGNSPEVLRIPAFLFGLLCIPAIYLLCRRMGLPGLVASLCMAVWPYMLLYSTNARGYTMLVFLFILLVMLAHHVGTRPTMAGAVVMAAIAAIGMFVMPSMLFAIAGVLLWTAVLLLSNGHGPQRLLSNVLIPFGLAFPAMTLLLYSPVIFVSNGLSTIVANAHVTPQEWPVFMEQLLPHFSATARAFVRDVPPWSLATLLGLAIVGFVRSWKRDKGLLLFLPALLAGAAVVLLYNHRIPFDRTWIHLLPVAFLLMDAGHVHLSAMLTERMQKTVSLAIAVVFAGWAGSLLWTRPIPHYPDTGTLPEARDVVDYLHGVMAPGDRVTVVYPSNMPVYYYLRLATGRKQQDGPSSGTEYVVVDSRIQTLADVTGRPAELLARIGLVEAYRADTLHSKHLIN